MYLYDTPARSIVPLQTTYTQARANFARLCDQVLRDRETVIIKRRGAEDVALVSASELSSFLETNYLLRSPKNAERLRQALARSQKGSVKAASTRRLRRDLGLE